MKASRSRDPFTPPTRRMALALGALALAGCTLTPLGAPEPTGSGAFADGPRIDAATDATIARLYRVVPGSQTMVAQSAGVLVFPEVIGGAFIIGAQHGRGALRVGGRTAGYYSTTGASIGWQAGGQSKSVIYVFNTQDALRRFQTSQGWTAGVDATVAAGKLGATGSIDSQTAQQPVVSFVLNNVGLEAGVSLTGAKITRIVP
ncbi:MAG TPA: YSC84-related protein [Ottowia sp.]|uniref:BPSL1445 family SYLF domain-containing lipoprotein n=1 Tax=Ottowia sp. TaxID=1898956 RepID=UPI002C8695A1|nr:YSC84-related protein [Ottowia sp.]HMN20619.1 YSC84-related protein [Ottowia sp.]